MAPGFKIRSEAPQETAEKVRACIGDSEGVLQFFSAAMRSAWLRFCRILRGKSCFLLAAAFSLPSAPVYPGLTNAAHTVPWDRSGLAHIRRTIRLRFTTTLVMSAW